MARYTAPYGGSTLRGDPVLPARFRRAQVLGTAGSVLLAAGALGAGALPVTGGGWPRPPLLTGHAALICCYLGLTLLVCAWLGLGGAVRAGLTSTRSLLRTALLWAAPLVLAPPLYSRDVYSYVVQGAMYRDGIDPYRYGASSYAAEMAANVSPFWQDSTAPYGPVFLVLAAAVMTVAGGDVVVGVLGMRAVMLVAVAATALLLLRLTRGRPAARASALWLGLLNPLLLAHLVSGAHNDAIVVALVIAAMALGGARRPLLGALLIGVAVLAKASAVVALPFLVPAAARRLAGPDRPLSAGTVVAGGAAVGVAAAAGTLGVTAASGGWYGWVTALADTARVHNGLSLSTDLGMFLGWLERQTGLGLPVDPLTVARLVAMAAAAVLLLVILGRTRGQPLYGLGLAALMVVALGPVVHPWYALWGLVPLAVAGYRPGARRVILAVSVPMCFYPIPSGGGPTPALAFGVLGIAAGLAVAWFVLRTPAPARAVAGLPARVPDLVARGDAA